MSTEISSIKGRFEYDKDEAKRQVGYKPAVLDIKTFFGGELNGKMCQLSIHQEDGSDASIQLTNEQTKGLIEALLKAL